MSDAESAPAPAAASPKKKKTSTKPKKPRTVPAHPKVSAMVESAISSLKERGGSSLQAIKKYISSHYKVDIERLSPFIKKYLKTAVTNGTLVQTKGKGASGSFRMSSSDKKGSAKPVAKKAKNPAKKAAGAKKAKPAAKKAAKPKKPAAKKTPKKPAKKPKVVKKPKSPKPKKAKPAKKTPVKKATKGKK